MSSSLRLLVFDLDGTLIDSSEDLTNSVNAMLVHLGKSPLPHAVISSYIGDGAAMLVRRALGDPGDADSAAPAHDEEFQTAFRYFLSYYREHKLDNTRPYPGVLDALQTLRALFPNASMAILTNKPVGPSRDICDALGLSPYFFQNYGGDSFPTKKPDPTGLLQLIQEASALQGQPLLPDEVVMIGDSDVDVLTARRASTRALGCSYGLAPYSLTLAEPDSIVATPSEWPAALQHLFSQS
ncbi:MAG: HAD hydrolase-like protein [Acidobacteriaceae bacterium]|nr:HAD hydrolase-like protein [Acidobacteriaceae bacterium]